MPNREKEDNSFIAQAGILAVAGIVSRIIGLLYTSPVSSIIGDLGLGYYQSAYSYYTIILLVSSYSIPAAISKVIAQRLGIREYRNAHRYFYGALFYVLAVGAAFSLFLYFGAGLFVEEKAIPVLRTFAPTIFVYGILGVLRGYFQAHRSMVQTSVSQILEQIANASVSILAPVLLIRSSFGNLEWPEGEERLVERAVTGARGSALGTGAGVLFALIFMALAYAINRKAILGRVARDRTETTEGYGQILKTITLVVTPFILSTAVYNLSDSLNTKFYTDWYPRVRELDLVGITSIWGIFSGKSKKISNIPVAFASAMAAAMLPSIAQMIARRDEDTAREKIGIAVKTTMLISIPCAVGLFALAGPVTLLLFPSSASNLAPAKYLLMALSVSIVFYSLSTLSSTILQGIGKLTAPIGNAGIALAAQTVLLALCLFLTPLDIYSVVLANTLYAGLMAYLNQRSVARAIGYQQEVRRTFLLPLAASAGMGIAAYLIYRLFLFATGSMRIAVIPAVIAAVPVYFVLLLLLGAVSEEEILEMPKGGALVRIARKMRLL